MALRVRLRSLSAAIAFMAWSTIATAADPPEARADAVMARLATASDPAQQYSLYLPPGYPAEQGSPLLVILDARGRGEPSLRLAADAARANGWVLLSSWQSSSDSNEIGTLNALQALLGESLQRYRIDRRRIYLAGLSGTAKTLWTRADMLAPLLAGMIGVGGGRPPELGPLRRPPGFAFAGIAGSDDFNYFEMRDLDAALSDSGATRRLFVFDGEHGWPPPDVYADAIDWLEMMAMRDGRAPRRDAFVDARFEREHAAAGEARGLDRWRRLEQILRDYCGLRDLSALQAEAGAARRDPAVARDLARERRLHGEEADATRRLDAWIARVGSDSATARRAAGDVRGAFAELRIAALRRLAGGGDRGAADSATRRLRRIDAFTGFYLPERFLARGETGRAASMLRLSLAINPVQPWLHWRLAKLHAAGGEPDAAFAELQAAREGGAFDAASLRDDPAWAALRDDPRWSEASAPPAEP
jgi:predicted esterase